MWCAATDPKHERLRAPFAPSAACTFALANALRAIMQTCKHALSIHAIVLNQLCFLWELEPPTARGHRSVPFGQQRVNFSTYSTSTSWWRCEARWNSSRLRVARLIRVGRSSTDITPESRYIFGDADFAQVHVSSRRCSWSSRTRPNLAEVPTRLRPGWNRESTRPSQGTGIYTAAVKRTAQVVVDLEVADLGQSSTGVGSKSTDDASKHGAAHGRVQRKVP